MAVKIGPGVPEFVGTRRFRVLRRLGSGGMGAVYEAFDEELRSRVALKTLNKVDPQDLFRLKREFRALQGLEHPNLLRLGELVEERGLWCFSMELVSGVSFLDWVRRSAGVERGQRLPSFEAGVDEGRLRAAMAQLAAALGALHEAGKVHRDLKPSNILVTAEGRLVVLDFGLIKDLVRADRATTTDVVMGTAGYMAPEQAQSQRLGPPADWYAAGAMLYEAMVGHPPFVGAFLEVLYAKLQSPPPPPGALVPGVPADLEQLCLGLLEFDPARRPTGDEVLGRLGVAPPPRAAQSAAPVGPVKGGLPGRDAELGVLVDALAAVSPGRPVTVLVRGASGAGKTALVRRFLARVRRGALGAALVLEGRCYENETVPFKALDSTVDGLSTWLRRLDPLEAVELIPRDVHTLRRVFPVLDRVEVIAKAPLPRGDLPEDLQELQGRAFAALRELLHRIAEAPRRVVIFIDDLQWGDEDSARALGALLRPPEAPPVLLVGAHSTGREGAFLRELSLVAGDWDHREIVLESPEHTEAPLLRLRAALLASFGGEATRGREALLALISGLPGFEGGEDDAAPTLWRQLRERSLTISFRPVDQLGPELLQRLDLVWSALVSLTALEPGRGERWLHQHVIEVLEAGEPARIARALALLLVVAAGGFRPESRSRDRLLELIRAASERAGDQESQAWLELAAGAALSQRGRLRSGLALITAARERFAQTRERAGAELTHGASLAALALIELGEIDEARLRFPLWLEEAHRLGDRYLAAMMSLFEAYRWLAADAPQGAEGVIEPALAVAATGAVDRLRAVALLVRCDVALYRGVGDPWGEVDGEAEALLGSRLAKVGLPLRHQLLTRRARAALLRAGAPGAARDELLGRAEKDAFEVSLSAMPTLQPLGSLILACVQLARGELAQALALLEVAALDCDGPEGSTLVGDCARWRRGQLLGGAEGWHMIASARDHMARLGLRNQPRWVSLFAPASEEAQGPLGASRTS